MAQAIKVELCTVGMPKELSLEGDVKENWRRFEREFRAYLAASGDKTLPENMKVPMLLNVIGRVGKKLYKELTLSEDEKWKLPIVLRELERKIVKKNVVYERFLLHTRKQAEGESFDSFVKDLRFLVMSCQYGDLEESILRDHVVFGVQDNLLQQRLLQLEDLDLETAIQICRDAEETRYQGAIALSPSETLKLEGDSTGEIGRKPKRCDAKTEESFTTKFEECYLTGGTESLLDDASMESLKLEPADDPPRSAELSVKLEVDLHSTVERMVVASSRQPGDCYQGLAANLENLLEQPSKSSKHWHDCDNKNCKTCVKQLLTKSSLRPRKLTQRVKQPHKCETCNKSFTTKSNLNHHLLRHKKVHHCNICSKSFLTKEFLAKHILLHNTAHDSIDLQSPENTLKCDVCEKSFVSKYSLKDHMLAHLGKQPHECNVCGKSFSKLGHFKEHVLIHKGVRPFQCGFCNKDFSRKWYLNQHMLAHEIHRPFQCEMCRKAYKSKFNLMKHLETHSNEISIAEEMIAEAHKSETLDGSYHCDICNKKFALKNNLTSHILVHLGKQPHQCELCNKRFLKKGHLKKHMTTYHQLLAPQFECHHCNEIFPSKMDLEQHSTIHTSAENTIDLPFHCEICNKRYSNGKILKWHMIGHTQGMNHKCEVCEKTFTRVEYLRKHQKSHYSSSFSCEVCGNSYRFSESLVRHMRSHGPQSGFDYECDICKKKFTKLFSYNRHFAAKHRPREHVDKFQCDTCSKILTNKQGLELHMRTHTGEKPHQCHICSQCFTQRGSLTIHLLKHSGEKPHSCSVCGKGFQTKEYIKKHMLIHTGDLPHSCEICNKRFTVKSNLNKHMMSHNNKQLVQCQGCKIFVGKDYLKMHLCAEDRPYQCDKCEKKFTLKDYLRKHMHTHKKK